MSRSSAVPPDELADADLRRELTELHDTWADRVLVGSAVALRMHTHRMLALEQEVLARLRWNPPLDARAGGRDTDGSDDRGLLR
jgi:hypothetical protein